MKARITIITLGVDDLERSLSSYRDGFGLPTQGIMGQAFEYGALVFFELQHGIKLALWPRTSIAHDTHLPVHAPSATDFTLAHNVSSKEEVDLVMQQAKAAGATIIKAAHEAFYGGYAGYFQDPHQHVWEIAAIPSSCLTNPMTCSPTCLCQQCKRSLLHRLEATSRTSWPSYVSPF